MTRHRQTLHMRPVPERFAHIYRRRGMTIPELHSGHHTFAIVPYRLRALHRAYAATHRLFWMPCVLCERPFGGHEIGESIPDPTRGPGAGTMICPACTAERNGGRP